MSGERSSIRSRLTEGLEAAPQPVKRLAVAPGGGQSLRDLRGVGKMSRQAGVELDEGVDVAPCVSNALAQFTQAPGMLLQSESSANGPGSAAAA